MDSVRYVLAGALLSAAISAGAVMSRQRPVEVAAPDGTTVTVTAIGDEHSRRYVDDKGNNVEWIASKGGAKSFVPRRVLDERCAAMSRSEAAAQSAPLRLTSFPTMGERRFLVILVEFADKTFATQNPAVEFDNMFNADGYSTLGGTGSVAEYYRYCSGGQFDPIFDVVGPVQLSHGYAYYGGGADDSLAGRMVVEACSLLDGEVDFSAYDLDGDGEVDSVYFIYAGKGEADGGDPDTIWPHSWNLSDQGRELSLDGVDIQGYACSPELDGSAKLNGMGTPCHEFAHVLGLPDLYCTNSYVSCLHPGAWSLMASGNYNNDGRTPPMLSVYERYELGWVSPQELNHPLTVSMHKNGAGAPSADVYRISTERTNEYFLFENRQQSGWDAYLPGHGMLVWHIDYNPNIWDRNRVNATPEHQYVDIVEANNATASNQGSGFTFPGTARVTSFTSTTRPALLSWAGVAIDLPLTSISELADGTVTFNVAGGKTAVGVPADVQVADIGMEQFTVAWTAAEAAKGHRIRVNDMVYPDVPADVCTAVVDNLWPGNTYTVQVCGYDEWEQGAWSNPIEVVMPDPTFEYMKVEALPAHNVTGTSFTAIWQPLEDAVEYSVDLVERSVDGGDVLTCDFTDKILPEGFTTTSNTWVSIAGYYGEAAPALRLNVDGDTFRSAYLPDAVSELSFVYRGGSVEDGAEIVVEGAADASVFTTLATLPVESQMLSFSLSTMPDDIHAVRLRFVKSGKTTVSIDDVCITYGSTVTDTPVRSAVVEAPGTSVAFGDLTPYTHYIYTVGARSASGGRSITSSPVHLITSESSGVTMPSDDSNVEQSGEGISELYDLNGRRVDMSSMEAPAPGIYIIRTGAEVRKTVILR